MSGTATLIIVHADQVPTNSEAAVCSSDQSTYRLVTPYILPLNSTCRGVIIIILHWGMIIIITPYYNYTIPGFTDYNCVHGASRKKKICQVNNLYVIYSFGSLSRFYAEKKKEIQK